MKPKSKPVIYTHYVVFVTVVLGLQCRPAFLFVLAEFSAATN